MTLISPQLLCVIQDFFFPVNNNIEQNVHAGTYYSRSLPTDLPHILGQS